MKVGIFGGTFNPIHYGHLRAAEEVKERMKLDKILFIPSGKPPLKSREIAAVRHRYEMTRMAIQDNPSFGLSDLECRMTGKSYTVKTIERLHDANPDSEFSFIIGMDAFLDIPNWWKPERLMAITNFIIISRHAFGPGDLRKSPYISHIRAIRDSSDRRGTALYKVKLTNTKQAVFLKLTSLNIASTEIRSLIRQGKSIKYLLPAEVQSYIITNKLYKG
jgi:nicotinate-nucleotide adenylyltransferase